MVSKPLKKFNNLSAHSTQTKHTSRCDSKSYGGCFLIMLGAEWGLRRGMSLIQGLWRHKESQQATIRLKTLGIKPGANQHYTDDTIAG